MQPHDIGRAIAAFMSEDCPSCGGRKLAPADAFCLDCQERLPADLLELVTDRATYLEAFGPAMRHLRSAPAAARAAILLDGKLSI